MPLANLEPFCQTIPKSIVKKQGIYEKYIKRPMDFTLALLALIVLSPVFLVVAVLIKLSSKGSAFFIQKRLGKNMKIFNVYKFRTMVEGAVLHQKLGVEVTKNDDRITVCGSFLRRYKLDELTQLINILKGEMAIVGPRPTLAEYLNIYEKWELKRFNILPGLTGLAQVNGNIHLERQEKSLYDITYMEQISFLKDIKIICKTLAIVIKGEEKYINKVDLGQWKKGIIS